VAAQATVVAVSLASAFTFAISTSLKHASASQLARRDESTVGAWGRFARATLTHPLWLGAIAADAIGFTLQVIALHLGALALVQPLLISGLLFALILRSRAGQGTSRREIIWGFVLTGALGAFLLVAGVSNPSKPHGGVNHWPAIIAVVAAALLAGICILIGRTRSGSPAAALLGVAVGISYAATAALLKSVTNIALRGPVPVLTSWQLYAVIASGAAGLMLNQVAFRAGPLTASLPAIATVDPLISIALGIIIFHEHIHHGTFQGFWLSSLVLIIGIAAIQLARSGQEAAAAAEAKRLRELAVLEDRSPVEVVNGLSTPAPVEVVPVLPTPALPVAALRAPVLRVPIGTGQMNTSIVVTNATATKPGARRATPASAVRAAGAAVPNLPAASVSLLVTVLPLLARFFPRFPR
jgi:drug/metabolite transporter (DMT)-like permease